jgi:zinc transport system substrate-binding protein
MMKRALMAALAPLALLKAADPLAAAPKVVVTIKPLYGLVAQVMAGVASPQMLIKGAASPHVYALKPSEIAALNAADVVFRASDATEPFSSKLARTLPAQVEVVTLKDAPGVLLLERRLAAAFEPQANQHRHGHVADGRSQNYDGHIWLDPDNAKAMVDRIAEVLSAKDASNAAVFMANATALKSKLAALSAELSEALRPLAGRPYVVAHDAFQYLERRFDLHVVGAISLSPDVPPSAKRLAELRRKIMSLGAICVFGEPQFDTRLLDSVTEGTPARTGRLDAEGSALEPDLELYFTLMRKLALDLRACLLPPA